MDIANVIISTIVIVAIFWVLYIYSVRRAQYLVQQELESLQENNAEKEKASVVVATEQPEGRTYASTIKRSKPVAKSDQKNQNFRINPSIALGTGR